jgi:hypothetical protein
MYQSIPRTFPIVPDAETRTARAAADLYLFFGLGDFAFSSASGAWRVTQVRPECSGALTPGFRSDWVAMGRAQRFRGKVEALLP